ncbi:MAG: GNAT family N-acetyltransferase [Bacillota bacterium]|nr:GNAT family N-acetyltransferase [Bacillota bacterium]
MRKDDVPNVVRVHLAGFQGFFLTFLGPAFLGELYKGTLIDPSGIGFVAEYEEGICGFVTGTTYLSGFYKRLLRNRWWRFALASVLPVLKRPSIIPRLLRALSMPEKVNKKDGSGTLMSLAVLPEHQGSGIGKILVNAFFDEAMKRGCKKIFLTSDRDNNDAINLFYQNLGFSIVRQYMTPEGRNMNEYWRELVKNEMKGDEHV